NGYEVGATDFIVKPVVYDRFEAKMHNIVARIPDMVDVTIPVKTPDGTVILGASQIKYVEIMGHWLVFHTTSGDRSAYGSLKNFEPKLTEANFLRCNSCYWVNPRF
ncbi:MAG: LytTR family transcriptional regulator DNA-binding domain-containing protein, partial [Clostridia bacterium]|nr:LytTR family transcriptional regulator DNA-binding domain-containing protein [Clostridia bacterium]